MAFTHPALFLDRDGIFNELIFRDARWHSPRNWSEVKHYPLDGLVKVKDDGFKLILVTNQPDIERGIITSDFVDDLNGYYQKLHQLDAIYCCPYAASEHPSKKPNPGMLIQAQKEHQIDFSRSFLLGDTDKDVQAAARCQIPSIVWTRSYNAQIRSDFRVDSLEQLLALVKA